MVGLLLYKVHCSPIATVANNFDADGRLGPPCCPITNEKPTMPTGLVAGAGSGTVPCSIHHVCLPCSLGADFNRPRMIRSIVGRLAGRSLGCRLLRRVASLQWGGKAPPHTVLIDEAVAGKFPGDHPPRRAICHRMTDRTKHLLRQVFVTSQSTSRLYASSWPDSVGHHELASTTPQTCSVALGGRQSTRKGTKKSDPSLRKTLW